MTDSGETTSVPPWAIRPVASAKKRARWSHKAEQYDPETKLRGSKKHRRDDPRPHAGYTSGGEYNSHEPGDGGVYHRFECVKCGLGKVLTVGHNTKTHQIKFACPACRKQTYHNPAGFDPRVLVPFDCETIPVGRETATDGGSE